MVCLAKTRDDEGACRQARKTRCALVRLAVEDHVFVHLVADEQDVGWRKDLLQLAHVFEAPYRGAGIVRAVDHHGAGLRADGGADLVEVGPEGAGCQRYAHRGATGQLDVGHVAVVTRIEHDHLVAGPHDRQDGGDDGLRGAGGDGDFRGRIVGAATMGPVPAPQFCGNRLAQERHAHHRRVLVQAAPHRVRNGVDEGRVAVEIRKTLAQVHRAFFRGQGRHDGEYGGADGRQLGHELGCAHCGWVHGFGMAEGGFGTVQRLGPRSVNGPHNS